VLVLTYRQIISGLLRAKGFAERNRKLEVNMGSKAWNAATFSVFLLTSLTSDNGFYVSNPTFGSNASENFLLWVEECIVTRVRLIKQLTTVFVSVGIVVAAPGARRHSGL
jgi:hypothetical protein